MTKTPQQDGSDDGFVGAEHRTLVMMGDMFALEQRLMAFIKSCLGKQQGNAEPMFYKPKQVAAMTGISEHTLRRKLRERQLEGIQEAGAKGSWLIRRETVEALLQSMRRAG